MLTFQMVLLIQILSNSLDLSLFVFIELYIALLLDEIYIFILQLLLITLNLFFMLSCICHQYYIKIL